MIFVKQLMNLKFFNGIKFYYNFLVSWFVNGGSWKLDRIVELDNRETRKIVIRHMSAYEELFGRQERVQH
ncbi:MAG: hypothetical protein BWY80_00332 [Firmicutes bacterium ADurb.Bin456]|nr:MAG: hypothetical protein BWY80_00332 [Firmicutes bacterium ADurb.Bin456]